MTNYHAEIVAATMAGDVARLSALAHELAEKAALADALAMADRERKADQKARQQASRSRRAVTVGHVTSRDVTDCHAQAVTTPASPLVPPPSPPGPTPTTPLNPPSTPFRAGRAASKAGSDRPPRPAPSRPSWLAEIAPTWEAKFGAGSFPWGKAGKTLKPLHDAGHGSEVIHARLTRYLATVEPQFVSLPRFVETFDQHQPLKLKGPAIVGGWMSEELERLTRPDGYVPPRYAPLTG